VPSAIISSPTFASGMRGRCGSHAGSMRTKNHEATSVVILCDFDPLSFRISRL
jgi:hypothetical protein